MLEADDGLEHLRLPLSEGRSPRDAAWSMPLRYGQIALAARRAGLVHVHGDVAAALAVPLAVMHRAVWTTHGLHGIRRARGAAGVALRQGVRAACAATRYTICTSKAEHAELTAILPPRLARRLLVVYNGVRVSPLPSPDEVASARVALDVREGQLAILFLGELEERKGPLVAAAAVERARADGADVVLLAAGDGSQGEALRGRGGPGIRVLGSRRDVPRLLAAADALILPSAREGLSMAVLEAMERGVPCVVSDGAGNPEAVGDTGIVVPRRDVDGMAAAVTRLIEHPEERLRLGQAARRRAERHFSSERLAAQTFGVYRSAGLDT